MHRRMSVFAVLGSLILLIGCSEKSATSSAPVVAPPTAPPVVSRQKDPNVTNSKLNANGVAAHYAARFSAGKLIAIEEQREPRGGTVLNGEYTFEGARLIEYRGAKVATPAKLDLQFDMQGALQSERSPDLSDEDLAAIRNRAQLLRSHALAQRASQEHSAGH